jgi:hypothetical protein
MRFTAGVDHVAVDWHDTGSFFKFGADESITFEVAFRTSEHGSGGLDGAGTLISSGLDPAEGSWTLDIVDGKLRFALADDTGATAEVLADGLLVADGEWHQVIAVRDVSDHMLKLYVDEQLAGAVPDPTLLFTTEADVFIGQYGDGIRQFAGDIDFIRVSSGALALAEMSAVPEPSTLALAASAALGLLFYRRRARRNASA